MISLVGVLIQIRIKGMKKILLISLSMCAMVLFCTGCANDVPYDTESTSGTTEKESEENDLLNQDDLGDEELCFEVVVDEEIIKNITDLIMAERELCFKLECETKVDEDITCTIEGIEYSLVCEDGIQTWSDYEEVAKLYYSNDYVERIFTPRYFEDSPVFVEQNGSLYRTEADGIVFSLDEESVKVWKISDDVLYVTVIEESVSELSATGGYVVQKAKQKPFCWEIISQFTVH